MSYVVLARKWRPKNFEDVVGQSHITEALKKSLQANRIGHAYLFSGTRGIGKTSLARLYAKAIRCPEKVEGVNPCHQCEACLDFENESSLNVVEIDGASNNSVDNIRELIQNVQYLPSMGEKKVYIIDEVHMLSVSAFNALLKTLEEPPEHVVFILATTEPQKLLGTVLSRCQRFDFREASIDELVSLLKNIFEKEKISFESEAVLQKLAYAGRGSIRDTLSTVEQVLCYALDKKLTETDLSHALGLPPDQLVAELFDMVMAEDPVQVSKVVETSRQQNIDLKELINSFQSHLFEKIQSCVKGESTDFDRAELIWIFESVLRERSWLDESQFFEPGAEILLQKIALRRDLFSRESLKKKSLVEEEQAELSSGHPEEEISEDEFSIEWSEFLNWLPEEVQALAAFLKNSNILETVKTGEKAIALRLGFKEAGKVFYEHLQDNSKIEKIEGLIQSYKGLEQVRVTCELIEDTSESFKTISEGEEEERDLELKRRENKLLNDPFVKEAEEMFNTKIDKVIVKQ